MKRIIGIVAAAAAVSLSVAGCQDGVTTPSGGPQTPATTVSAAGSAPATVPAQSPENPTQSQGNPTQSQGNSRPPADTAPATAANGRCVSLTSPVVTQALGTLGGGVGGDGFYAESGTDAAVGSCPALLWVRAGTPHGTASSPWHVMLFNHDGYLGTATKRSTSYTSVVGSSDRTVQVQYRWLSGNDANCCPSGGPSVVTLTLGSDGHSVTPDRDFPAQAIAPK
ncbi:LppP/LprE family lipoprotein [Nocardia sp. NPDC005825]|uniref:LppP/LprE family lipoprotein n=1 Tax=unclassified Nocardia TaxID=2637762 RepID=UPI0033F2EEB7